MPLSVEDFLSKYMAVELLCEISLNGSRFSELEEALDMASDTLTNRLTEGMEASVLKTELASGEGRGSHKYLLTKKGALIRWKLDTLGATESYHVSKNARQRFEQHTEDLRTWVAENPDALESDEWNRNLQFHQRYRSADSTEIPYDADYDVSRLDDSE
jgi:DNA-binding HxlR family transcriptional regulator